MHCAARHNAKDEHTRELKILLENVFESRAYSSLFKAYNISNAVSVTNVVSAVCAL